jgi:hypothetical protein
MARDPLVAIMALGCAGMIACVEEEPDSFATTEQALSMVNRAQVDLATLHSNHGGYAAPRVGANAGNDGTGRVSWKQGGFTLTSTGQVSTCNYGWCGFPSIGSGCQGSESEWGYSYGACNSSAWGQRFGGYLEMVDRPAGSGDHVHASYMQGASGTTTFGYHPYWSVIYNGECRIYQGWSYTTHSCSGTPYVVNDPSVCGNGTCQSDESCSSCPADCGACPSCGDGACNGSETCSTCAGDCGVCPPGIHVTGLAGSSGTTHTYSLVVPADATSISFVMAGGTGDADLYVRKGSPPTTSTYDCRPYLSGNNESCSGSGGGTYYVMIRGYSAFSGVSFDAGYSVPVAPVCGDLTCNGSETCGTCAEDCGPCPTCGDQVCNGSETCSTCANDCGACPTGLHEINLAATTGNSLSYTMVVPTGGSNVQIQISGGTGDADLYVRKGSPPTTSSYDCRPYSTGNNESCTGSGAGTYYIMVRAYATYSGVALDGTFSL